jgi:hypothetical protein
MEEQLFVPGRIARVVNDVCVEDPSDTMTKRTMSCHATTRYINMIMRNPTTWQ